ncbi:hypothetical protein [Micromonospora sp. 067-2]|uniref:hypothetical protein n=1 Tax=Micromonospora sp. 067-2 TaxID=2789270 RepID=UPI00397C4BED
MWTLCLHDSGNVEAYTRKMHEIAGASSDGRVVVGAHQPTPGECSCGWQLRHFLVDVRTGVAVELAPQDARWRKANGTGWMKRVVFLPSGGFVAQVNTLPSSGDQPLYRLVRYGADGKVLGSSEVPDAGTTYGTLIG